MNKAIMLLSGAAGAALMYAGVYTVGATLLGISILIIETTKAK